MFDCRRRTSTVGERRETSGKRKERRANRVRNYKRTEISSCVTLGNHPLQNTPRCLRPAGPLVLFPSPLIAFLIAFPLLDFYFHSVLLFRLPFLLVLSSLLCPLVFCLFFPSPPFSFTGINCVSLSLSFYSSLFSSFLFPPFPAALFHSASSHESFARLGARVFTNRALFLDVPTTERSRAFSSRVVPPAFLPVAVSFLASCPTFFPSSLCDRSGSTSVSFSLFLSLFLSSLSSSPFLFHSILLSLTHTHTHTHTYLLCSFFIL